MAHSVRLVLYVNPLVPASQHAQRVVESAVARFDLVTCEVVDVFAGYERAEEDRVIFTPTLVKKEPPPPAWLVGQVGEEDVLSFLAQSGMEPSR